MQVIEGKIVTETEWQQMARHMDKLRGQNYRLRRDRTVLFWMFTVTALALGYVLANVPV